MFLQIVLFLAVFAIMPLWKKVKINFGFTKERFDSTDIPGYDGPALVTSDNADLVTPEKSE
jgi:hypothetical protein